VLDVGITKPSGHLAAGDKIVEIRQQMPSRKSAQISSAIQQIYVYM
jgi:hypothetical protein